MARPQTTQASPTRSATPPASEPGTLVRLRAAAAAVGVDEDELKRRAQAVGVKIHTLVRAGEAQAALDLNDVWRLRNDGSPAAAAEIAADHPEGLEVSRVTSRLEREAQEYRERHEEALQRGLKLEEALRAGEQALRLEKSKQAELEAQLSESARSLAETQRALMELRAAQAAREREFRTQLDDERRTGASNSQAIEAAKLQAESAAGARVHAEKRLQEATALLSASKDDLAAARKDNERLTRELGEVKSLRARLAEAEAALAKSAAALATEQSEGKSLRERALGQQAALERLEQEVKRLGELEKTHSAQAKRAEDALAALAGKHSEDLARREAESTRQRAAQEQRLQEALASAGKADAARAIFERELSAARSELDKLEESCARASMERDRLKQKVETLVGQLATASEGEKALQRYADRKEAELAQLRKEVRK